jgi:CHASE2 domain-containing sensor protein
MDWEPKLMWASLRNIWSDVKGRGPRYWIFAGLFILAGVAASGYLDKHYFFLGPRYAASQLLQRTIPGPIPHARRVVFVSIGDDEFWKGDLDRRIPVKRDYLARLVAALDAVDPEIIALDFTLRSPVADGTIVETPAYSRETARLIDVVEHTTNAAIVLPLTVNEFGYDKKTNSYPLDSNIFGHYQFKNPHVKWGYTNLSLDIRRIPLYLRIKGHDPIPSFSQQMAVILDPGNQSARRSSGAIFGSFMPVTSFRAIPAAEVLSSPAGKWREQVRHHAVIVGSFAHKDAYGRGPYIDGFQTPVGDVPGAAVHANWVEALVHEHVFPVVPDWARDLVEVLLSLLVSIILARTIAPFAKAGYFVSLVGSAFVASYLLQQNLGVFFDPFLPVLFVAVHSLGEEAFGPRH